MKQHFVDGKCGRILGEIFLGGNINLNTLLTEKGHAERYEI